MVKSISIRELNYPLWARLAVTGLFVAVWVPSIVLGVLYWRRRKRDVIAARSPGLMLATLTCGYIGYMLEGIPLLWRDDFYCSGYAEQPLHWLRTACLMASFALPVWACLTLISKFETQRLRLAIQLREQGFDAPLDANFFQRHLAFLTSRAMAGLLVVVCAAPVAREIVTPVYTQPHIANVPERLSMCALSEQTFSVLFFTLVFTLCLLAFKVRTVSDAFQITYELKWLGLVVAGHILVMWFMIAIYPSFQDSLLYISESAFICIPMTYVALYLPVRYSYRKLRAPQPQHLAIPPEFDTLAGVLASKPGRTAFQTHLMHEFSLESLMFLTEVDAFRAHKPKSSDGALLAPKLVAAAPAVVTAPIPEHPHAPTSSTATAAVAGATGVTKPRSPLNASRSVGMLLSTPQGKDAAAGTAVGLTPPTKGGDPHATATGGAAAEPPRELTLEEARDAAIALYKKFVAKNAPFEINLPHKIAAVLHRELGGVDVSSGKANKKAVGGNAFRRHSTATLTAMAFGPTVAGGMAGSGAAGAGKVLPHPHTFTALSSTTAGGGGPTAAMMGPRHSLGMVSGSGAAYQKTGELGTGRNTGGGAGGGAAAAATAGLLSTTVAGSVAVHSPASSGLLPATSPPPAGLFLGVTAATTGSGATSVSPTYGAAAATVGDAAFPSPAAGTPPDPAKPLSSVADKYVAPHTPPAARTRPGAPGLSPLRETHTPSKSATNTPTYGPPGPSAGDGEPTTATLPPLDTPASQLVIPSDALPPLPPPSVHGAVTIGAATPTAAGVAGAMTAVPEVSVPLESKQLQPARRAFETGHGGGASTTTVAGGPRASLVGGNGVAKDGLLLGGGEAKRPSTASSHNPHAGDGQMVERTALFYLTIFDPARDDVWGLLEADSFVRFQNSALFVQLVQNATILDTVIIGDAARKPSSQRTPPGGAAGAGGVLSSAAGGGATVGEPSHIVSGRGSGPPSRRSVVSHDRSHLPMGHSDRPGATSPHPVGTGSAHGSTIQLHAVGGGGGGGGGGSTNHHPHSNRSGRKTSVEVPVAGSRLVHTGSQRQLSQRNLTLLSPHHASSTPGGAPAGAGGLTGRSPTLVGAPDDPSPTHADGTGTGTGAASLGGLFVKSATGKQPTQRSRPSFALSPAPHGASMELHLPAASTQSATTSPHTGPDGGVTLRTPHSQSMPTAPSSVPISAGGHLVIPPNALSVDAVVTPGGSLAPQSGSALASPAAGAGLLHVIGGGGVRSSVSALAMSPGGLGLAIAPTPVADGAASTANSGANSVGGNAGTTGGGGDGAAASAATAATTTGAAGTAPSSQGPHRSPPQAFAFGRIGSTTNMASFHSSTALSPAGAGAPLLAAAVTPSDAAATATAARGRRTSAT